MSPPRSRTDGVLPDLDFADEAPPVRRTGSSVSEPLLTKFLEANRKAAALRGGSQKPAALKSVLSSYIRSRDLPVRAVIRGETVWLERTDL